MNDDALYRRYRQLIVQPSLRKHSASRVVTSAYLFCVALAALSFALSLHLIEKAGAPWWVSLVGLTEGLILIPSYPLWPLRMSRGPWQKRLLSSFLFYVAMIGFPRLLAEWLIPKDSNSFAFTAGFLLAFASSAFVLLPILLLTDNSED